MLTMPTMLTRRFTFTMAHVLLATCALLALTEPARGQ